MHKKEKSILMMGLLVLFIVTVLFTPNHGVTGMVVNLDIEKALENPDQVKDMYNANLENIPSFAKTMFGSEVIDLEIIKKDGTSESLSIKTKKGAIETISKQRFKEEDYTLKVKVTEYLMNDIANSDDQVARFKQALDNDEITYDSLRFITAVKMISAKTTFKIVSWFN